MYEHKINPKEHNMKARLSLPLLILYLLSSMPASAETARELLEASGIKGGFVVHIGCGDAKLTADLMISDSFRVHGLDSDAVIISAAREYLHSKGLTGKISVDQLNGDKLPYIDNLVNLIIIEPGQIAIDNSEILRVLAPNGIAFINGRKIVKPRPPDIDEWTHYMHDPGGNAVAQDTVIGPPRHMQWLGGPRWARHHDHVASMNAMVTAKGRLFYIMDEGLTASELTPPEWNLVARDAFNGIILWKERLTDWVPALWPLKSGPANLPRRLVAIDDTVYTQLGFTAPVTALAADSGEHLRQYDGSEGTEEIIVTEDILLAVIITKQIIVQPSPAALKEAENAQIRDDRISKSPLINYYWNTVQSTHWFDTPRLIKAYRASTGEFLWETPRSLIMPLTLAADAKRVYYHDGDNIIALDRETGKQVYKTDPVPVTKTRLQAFFAPTMVVHKGVIVFAGGEKIGLAWMGWESKDQGQDSMTAFNAETGIKLWSAPHPYAGYQSPEDILIADGLVWTADTAMNNAEGTWTGRDLNTGEIKREIPPTLRTGWFHHRCYRAKATVKYMLPSRNGIEFIDINEKTWGINHWVRSGCLYGIMPANGFIYNSPHNCACHPQAKLYGFNALAADSPTRAVPASVPAEGRLETGKAYNLKPVRSSGSADWPMYRHDAERSGSSPENLGTELKDSWSVNIGASYSGNAQYYTGVSRLTQPVVSGDLLIVSSIDTYTLYGFDAKSGKPRWTHVTGGRVDSPPAIYEGRVIFGSADGYVTCLRASDGELAWRFRAAPVDRRMMSFGQLESSWPVYGSVLVQNGEVFCTAGRSFFLDDGVRFYRLDVNTGNILAEKIFDSRHYAQEGGLQDKGGLDMPVGSPDILGSDGEALFMRSQVMDKNGNRFTELRHHLFAPYGFVDGSWFHRAYWVFGENYYGGCGGYTQAGKKYPSGRAIVHDDKNVYVYGRRQEYFRWITEMEYHLFSSPRAGNVKTPGGYTQQAIKVNPSPSLNPKGKPFSVEAWVKTTGDGVIIARGAQVTGYDLTINRGKLTFTILVNKKLYNVTARKPIPEDWTHVAGVLTPEQEMKIYVNGEPAGKEQGAFLAADPAEGMEIGMDDGGQIWTRNKKCIFSGMIDEVRIYDGALSDAEVKTHAVDSTSTAAAARLVLHYNFDDGTATDKSGNGNDGVTGMVNTVKAKDKFVQAMEFKGGQNKKDGIQFTWSIPVPILTRAMAKAGDNLYIAGPADIVDESEIITALHESKAQETMARQDALFKGQEGARLLVVSAANGKTMAEYKLDELPGFDGMSIANGCLYIVTEKGKLICMEAK